MSEPSDASARVVRQLRSLINSERLVAGERLGTERELAERLNVSRAILRLALTQLEGENLIKRLIGRGGGVFVSDGKVERELNWIVGVPTFLRQQGFRSSTTIVHSRLAVSGPDEARILRLDVGDPIYEVKRLRFANEIPLSLEIAKLPAQQFPHLLEKDLEGSLYSVITREYAHVLTRADEYIEARPALGDEASLLGIPESAPVLEFRRITTNSVGVVVEHAQDVFRADRIRVSAHAGGQPPNARVADRERQSARPREPFGAR
jgi:GntR family transcriptional regulator